MSFISVRDAGNAVTKREVEAALELLSAKDDNGEALYSFEGVLAEFNIPEGLLQKYVDGKYSIGNFEMAKEDKIKIINVLRAGATKIDVINHFQISSYRVSQLRRYIAISQENVLQELYDEPDYDLALQIRTNTPH